jgi:hypothetical protein
LIPPADIATAWDWHGKRARMVIALAAEEAQTEADFCCDLSLRLWHVIHSWPFVRDPHDMFLKKERSPDLVTVEVWLWGVIHALKARGLDLNPTMRWPPALPRRPGWPWPGAERQ